jgi:hypothetical protein
MKLNLLSLEEVMLRKLSLSAVALSLLASVAAAEIGFDSASDIRAEIAARESAIPAPAAAEAVDAEKGVLTDWLFGKPAPKGPAEWTIMVFGNGKNDLEPFLLKDLNEMEKIGSTDQVNIIVEAGRIAGYDASDGDWKGVRRYRMTKDSDTRKVSSKVLADLGDKDMGAYQSVIDFAKWAKAAYPAKRYMLIFWNHGAGWTKSGERIITKGISYDESSGNHINTPQMGLIMKALGKTDVVGTDACLMQMAEVNYEIKDSVEYIVASEETEPGDGYTYDLFLGPVVAKPAMTAMEVGKAAVNGYANHYDGIDQGYTQSLVKASAMNQLPALTDAFGAAVMAANEKALAKTSRDATINFAYDENRDLYDFVRRVVAGTKSDEVKTKGQALMTFITGSLVTHNRTRNDKGGYWSGPKESTLAKGIAAYFPKASLGAGYTDLAWAKVSKWDEFTLWINQP